MIVNAFLFLARLLDSFLFSNYLKE
jgi:hypothetical protein